MKAKEKKAMRERLVFQAFIKASGLPVILESVESRNEPEPDILCVHKNSGKLAFELVEICDEQIAQRISEIGRNEFGYLRTVDPTGRILREKLKKKYETEYPIDLLCYVGRTTSPDDMILSGIRRKLEMKSGQFQRAWLFVANVSPERWYLAWPVGQGCRSDLP